jgi:hypothetical protein
MPAPQASTRFSVLSIIPLFFSCTPRRQQCCSSSRSFIIIKLLSWRTSFSRVWTGARAPAASLRALRSTRLHNFLRVMGVVCP